VVVVLSNTGDHEPIILFVEVVGSACNDAPEQIALIGAKVGVKLGLTVTCVDAEVTEPGQELLFIVTVYKPVDVAV
jgi:hypothetical protein